MYLNESIVSRFHEKAAVVEDDSQWRKPVFKEI
jgi:hypothetical protein